MSYTTSYLEWRLNQSSIIARQRTTHNIVMVTKLPQVINYCTILLFVKCPLTVTERYRG